MKAVFAFAVMMVPSVVYGQVWVSTSSQDSRQPVLTTSPQGGFGEPLPPPVFNGGASNNGGYNTPSDLPPPVFLGNSGQQQRDYQPLPAPSYNGDASSAGNLPTPVFNGGGNTFQPLPPPIFNVQPQTQYQQLSSYNRESDVEPLPSPRFNVPSAQSVQQPMFDNYQQNQAPRPSSGATYWDPISRTFLDNSPVNDSVENESRNRAVFSQSGNNNGSSAVDYVTVYQDQPQTTYVPYYVESMQPSYQAPRQAATPNQGYSYQTGADQGPSFYDAPISWAINKYQNSTNNVAFKTTSVVGGVVAGVALVELAPVTATAAGVFGVGWKLKSVYQGAKAAADISQYLFGR